MRSRRCERCGRPIYGESSLCAICSGSFEVSLLGYPVPPSPPAGPSLPAGVDDRGSGHAETDAAAEYDCVSWSCILDDDCCPTCTALDGTYWLAGHSRLPVPPQPECTNPDGCRCVVTYESGPEDQRAELRTFLESRGGFATPEQMIEYAGRPARRRAAAAPQPAVADETGRATRAALKLEKTDPDRAIELYRSSLMVCERALAQPEGQCRVPADIHWLFNRLTLLLERLDRDEEALAELDRHRALHLPWQGPQALSVALEKRRERLLLARVRNRRDA